MTMDIHVINMMDGSCTTYTVPCALYTVYCTLYSVHCAPYTIHCTGTHVRRTCVRAHAHLTRRFHRYLIIKLINSINRDSQLRYYVLPAAGSL